MWLGFLSYYKPNKYCFILVLSILLYPSSTSFSFMNVFEGVFFYDSIIIGVLIAHFFKIRTHEVNFRLNFDKKIILILGVYFVYFLSALYSSVQFKYLLKDLRPVILIFECYIIYKLVVIRTDSWNIKSINKLVIIVGVLSIIKLTYFQISLSHINDDFYSDNSYRYLDAGTYFCVAYLLAIFCNKFTIRLKENSAYLAIICSVICIMVANSRFIIISMVLIILLFNYKSIKKTIAYLVSACFLVSAFILYSYYSGSIRVLDAFEAEALIYQITTRYEPALNMIDSFSINEFIFGTGIGKPFYIPWFSYRDLDPYNINIDSGYFTFYCKFGFISLFVTYCFLSFFKFNNKGQSLPPLFWFMCCIFIVSATPYQIYAIGIFLGYIITLQMAEKK
ncbi:DUF6369 family protein [Pseudocolwellia sp. AS88]|nr:DUF6369 family protein [Pseudocolwellia sp. AS88]MDO7086723.1 DUF6369 family protein [Pseudocolwellia sp. AS88]